MKVKPTSNLVSSKHKKYYNTACNFQTIAMNYEAVLSFMMAEL